MKYTEEKHHSHPHHLELVRHEVPYTCDGCKEIGFGLRYRCEPCNFDLHKDCIFASSSTTHPFYKQCSFNFYESPPGYRERYCDACGKDIKGFVYHCPKHGRDLHPCCNNLPNEIIGEGVKLQLKEKLSYECSYCGKRKLWKGGVTGWSYVSTCKDYHFHVSCVKEMLVNKWKNGHFLNVRNEIIVHENEKTSLTIFEHKMELSNVRLQKRSKYQKYQKYLRIFKMVVKVIVSTILGDPTAIVGSIVEALIHQPS